MSVVIVGGNERLEKNDLFRNFLVLLNRLLLFYNMHIFY